jgi:single-strand DNA-binding protein
MNNLNSILIEGNMVKDPLFRTTARGTSLCTFTLAANRYFKQESGLEKEVSFFDIETWSKLADNCKTLGRKGRGIRVVGRLKQNRWNDNEGKPHSRITIIAEHIEFRPDMKHGENSVTELSENGTVTGQAARSNVTPFPEIPAIAVNDELPQAVAF